MTNCDKKLNKKCLNCETIISDRATFCLKHRPSSMKGKKQTKEHKEKIGKSNTGQKRSKETIEKLRLSHLGKKQSEETKIKRGIYKKGKEHFRFGKKHSDVSKIKIGLASLGRLALKETKEKMRNARLGRKFGPMSIKGKENLSIAHLGKHCYSPSHFKKGCVSLNKGKKYSEERVAQMRLIGLNRAKKFKETSIEIAIKKELVKKGIVFKQNHSLLGIANVDFFLPDQLIVIECDGCFWHGCPEHNPNWSQRKEKDTLKTQKLIAAGYKVYRFWEHEIKLSPANCIDKISMV